MISSGGFVFKIPKTAVFQRFSSCHASNEKNKCLISRASAINMQMPDAKDMELLRNYDQRGSEEAFAELVRRHINLVYSAALRHVGTAAHAEEITQAVFIVLARKAGTLRPNTILEGWLYETTRLTALSFLRGERRRQFREQEAYMQSTLTEGDDAAVWNQLAPLLDEAVSRLGKRDRDAVVLRFFKQKGIREVAEALDVNESAAQRRVLRALEKLRKFFAKRGVSSTTVILAGVISTNSVQAAPVALATSVTTLAIAKGAAASASTLTLIKGALKIMAWTKAKTAFAVVIVGILLAGGTTMLIAETGNHHPESTDGSSALTGVSAATFNDALQFLMKIRTEGKLPGFRKEDHGNLTYRTPGTQTQTAVMEAMKRMLTQSTKYPCSLTFEASKNGDTTRSTFHYTVLKSSKAADWQLKAAWRTDRTGKTVETFSVE